MPSVISAPAGSVGMGNPSASTAIKDGFRFRVTASRSASPRFTNRDLFAGSFRHVELVDSALRRALDMLACFLRSSSIAR